MFEEVVLHPTQGVVSGVLTIAGLYYKRGRSLTLETS